MPGYRTGVGITCCLTGSGARGRAGAPRPGAAGGVEGVPVDRAADVLVGAEHDVARGEARLQREGVLQPVRVPGGADGRRDVRARPRPATSVRTVAQRGPAGVGAGRLRGPTAGGCAPCRRVRDARPGPRPPRLRRDAAAQTSRRRAAPAGSDLGVGRAAERPLGRGRPSRPSASTAFGQAAPRGSGGAAAGRAAARTRSGSTAGVSASTATSSGRSGPGTSTEPPAASAVADARPGWKRVTGAVLGRDLGEDRRAAVLAAQLLELPLPPDHPERVGDLHLEAGRQVAAGQVDRLEPGVGHDRRLELERRLEGDQLAAGRSSPSLTPSRARRR